MSVVWRVSNTPFQHAHAVENLYPFLKPGASVLDVGSGSGYLCALFHHLVSDANTAGKVVGVDHIPQLVDWSVVNLRKDGLGDAIDDGRIIMVAADGRKGEVVSLRPSPVLGCWTTSLIDEKLRPRKLFRRTLLVFFAGSTKTNCEGPRCKSPSSQKTICCPSLLFGCDL